MSSAEALSIVDSDTTVTASVTASGAMLTSIVVVWFSSTWTSREALAMPSSVKLTV